MRWMAKGWMTLIAAALLPLGALALDLGQSGIALYPPARGWKLEQRHDAAIEGWHLRPRSGSRHNRG